MSSSASSDGVLPTRASSNCSGNFSRAGYLENWEYNITYSGTPQGSGVSPILAKYLSQRTGHIRERSSNWNTTETGRLPLKPQKDTRKLWRWLFIGRKRKTTVEQRRPKSSGQRPRQMNYAKLLSIPCFPAIDPTFKNQYVRYADDFIISYETKATRESIKGKITCIPS